eukprot:1179104-Prorocentrum_minimum.AAC.4
MILRASSSLVKPAPPLSSTAIVNPSGGGIGHTFNTFSCVNGATFLGDDLLVTKLRPPQRSPPAGLARPREPRRSGAFSAPAPLPSTPASPVCRRERPRRYAAVRRARARSEAPPAPASARGS